MALVAAATVIAELGDITRFANPRQLMAYLGLVPSERSSGTDTPPRRHHESREWRGPTDADRGGLVPGAHQPGAIAAPGWPPAKPIRDTAWKAQERLCRRYRKLARAGKSPTVVTTAIARELAGFAWAIAKHVQSADA